MKNNSNVNKNHPKTWDEATLHNKWMEYAGDRGNIRLRNSIVEYYVNSKFVNTTIRSFNKKFNLLKTTNTNVYTADYRSAVYESLIDAVEKYDPSFEVALEKHGSLSVNKYVSETEYKEKGYKNTSHRVSFEQFANPLIRLACSIAEREEDTLTPYYRLALTTLEKARLEAGWDATEEEVINCIKIPKGVTNKNPAMTPVSYYKSGLKAELDAVKFCAKNSENYFTEDIGDDADAAYFDETDDYGEFAGDDDFENVLEQKEQTQMLYSFMTKLSEAEQYILTFYYGFGLLDDTKTKKLTEIATDLGKTLGRVSQIKSNIEKQLLKKFNNAGVYSHAF